MGELEDQLIAALEALGNAIGETDGSEERDLSRSWNELNRVFKRLFDYDPFED